MLASSANSSNNRNKTKLFSHSYPSVSNQNSFHTRSLTSQSDEEREKKAANVKNQTNKQNVNEKENGHFLYVKWICCLLLKYSVVCLFFVLIQNPSQWKMASTQKKEQVNFDNYPHPQAKDESLFLFERGKQTKSFNNDQKYGEK